MLLIHTQNIVDGTIVFLPFCVSLIFCFNWLHKGFLVMLKKGFSCKWMLEWAKSTLISLKITKSLRDEIDTQTNSKT